MENFTFVNKDFSASYDNKTSKITIKGKALPLDPFINYEPFYKWFNEYVKNPPNNTILYIELSDFNSVFTKMIVRIFLDIEKSFHKNKFKIVWASTENDIIELANDVKTITSVPFEIKRL